MITGRADSTAARYRKSAKSSARWNVNPHERYNPSVALIKCSECGREVSDKAAACPQCGAPVVAQAAAPATPPPAPAVAAPAAAPPVVKPRRRLRVTTLVLLAVLAAVVYVVVKMSSGSSLRGAVTGPETLASETVSLDEGQGREYSFTLPTRRRVEVSVSANPKPVNVFLMNEEDWQAYNKARQDLLGGRYTYRQTLSRKSVLNMKESDILPAGSWRVVVERPRESLFGGKSTATTVTVLAF